MRPPDLPGGNLDGRLRGKAGDYRASMRPPDLPGGNTDNAPQPMGQRTTSFNEAAGFTRRKRVTRGRLRAGSALASMRPPDLPGGNSAEIE